MNSQDPGIPEVLAALNTVTEEIRSFRQYTEDTWKAQAAFSRQNQTEYLAYRDEQKQLFDEQRRQNDKRQRRYELRCKLSWIVTGWFFFVSLLFIGWLNHQP